MKNQRGVTLIALVVTIIVLIILAGVTIAALTGQNGLITRSREAKMLQIQGEVGDRITLALATAKLYAERTATSSSSYFASENVATSIKDVIEEELPGTYSSESTDRAYKYAVTSTATANSGSTGESTITITYKTTQYEQAVNKTGANIVYTVKVKGNTFEITNIAKDDNVQS